MEILINVFICCLCFSLISASFLTLIGFEDFTLCHAGTSMIGVRPMFDFFARQDVRSSKDNHSADFVAVLWVHKRGDRSLAKHRPFGRWRLPNKDHIHRTGAPLDSKEIDAMLSFMGGHRRTKVKAGIGHRTFCTAAGLWNSTNANRMLLKKERKIERNRVIFPKYIWEIPQLLIH